MGFRMLFVGLLSFTVVPSSALGTTDPCTGTVAPSAIRASAGPAVTSVTRVLWDLTHFPYYGYEPSDRYTTLVSELASEGFSVSTTTAGVQNIDLSPYSVIVLCAGSAVGTAYTPAEVAVLQGFVNGGKGLLVMADNPEPDTGTPHLSPVTEAFGTSVGVSYLPTQLTFGAFTSHPIFAGIDSVYFQAGGELVCTSPGVAAAFAPDQRTTVGVRDGCGLVVTGDINFCDNVYIARNDNRRFAMNVFHWLADGCAATPARRATWGALKSAYR